MFFEDFISCINSLAGLKAGIKCSGISTAIFFLMLRPILAARFFIIKLPKPLIYIFSPEDKDFFTSLNIVSRVTKTSTLGMPVLSEIWLATGNTATTKPTKTPTNNQHTRHTTAQHAHPVGQDVCAAAKANNEIKIILWFFVLKKRLTHIEPGRLQNGLGEVEAKKKLFNNFSKVVGHVSQDFWWVVVLRARNAKKMKRGDVCDTTVF